MKIISSHFFRYHCYKKKLFHLEKTNFSTNTSFRLVETYFLSGANCMLLFRAFSLLLETIIKIRGNQFQKRNIFLLMKPFPLIFLPEEAVFSYIENVFFNKCFIPGNENEFSGSYKPLFIYIFWRLLPMKGIFPSSRNVFFEWILYSGYWRRILSLVETLLESSLY